MTRTPRSICRPMFRGGTLDGKRWTVPDDMPRVLAVPVAGSSTSCIYAVHYALRRGRRITEYHYAGTYPTRYCDV